MTISRNWLIGIGIVLLVAVVGIFFVGFWFGGPSGQSKAPKSGVSSVEGHMLAAGEEDLQKVGADVYDEGLENGLKRSGIKVLNREELRKLADEGIKKYSRYQSEQRVEQFLREKPAKKSKPAAVGNSSVPSVGAAK
jgi:hypothetical protein